jgi:NAD(P)-dependent dehydrogenase (short-subunit alcohol dehydrogenase family)
MIKIPKPANADRFLDQVGVVTGAAGGIGSTIAERLAAEGAHVCVADVDEDRARDVTARIVEAGGRAETVAFDLTEPGACVAAVDDVVERHGRVDVLVNNAGVNRRGDLLSITTDDWELSFRVNLDAMFHLCRAGAADHDHGRRRRDREHRLAVGPASRARAYRLQHVQGGRCRLHPEPGPRLWAARRTGERSLPGRGADADAGIESGPQRSNAR